MFSGRKRHVITGCAFVVASYLVGWLLIRSSSPLKGYFIHHVWLPNIWRALNIVPLMAGAVVAGNPHDPNAFAVHAVFIAQWFAVGYLLSKLFGARRRGARPDEADSESIFRTLR